MWLVSRLQSEIGTWAVVLQVKIKTNEAPPTCFAAKRLLQGFWGLSCIGGVRPSCCDFYSKSMDASANPCESDFLPMKVLHLTHVTALANLGVFYQTSMHLFLVHGLVSSVSSADLSGLAAGNLILQSEFLY